MILDKTVIIKINGSQLKYFRELGYEVYNNGYTEIEVSHLKKGSTIKLRRLCDDCGDEKLVERFVFGDDLGEYHNCISCSSKKRCGEDSPSYNEESHNKCLDCDKMTSKPEYLRCKECANKVRGGDSHYKWIEDRSKLCKRSGSQMEKWGNTVKLRDANTCILCSADDKPLEAHHLVGFSTDKILGYDVSNGVCLCNECHRDFHVAYGYGNNTAEQFEEFSTGELR